MTYRIPGGFGQVTHVLRLAGDSEDMVVTYGVGPDIDDDTYGLDAVFALHAQFAAEMATDLPNSYSLVRTELRYHITADADDDPLRVAVRTATTTGSGVAEAIPNNSAFLFHKRTAMAGRAGRGRFYLPGVQETLVGPTGVISAGGVTQWQGNADSWLAAIRSLVAPLDTLEMYLFHNVAQGELLAPLPTIVSSLSLDSRVATQRRRLRP